MSKLALVIYILLAPMTLYFFFASFARRYRGESSDPRALTIATLIVILSLVINQIILYPLTYFYYPLLLVPLALIGLYIDRFWIYIIGIVLLYITV
jgi:hypothetical protein